MTRKNASVRQRRVSSELRALRLAKGLSCDDVGKAVGCSESKISRMETGDRGLHADDVSAILGYLQAPPKLRQELLAMVREGEAKNWHEIHKDSGSWKDLTHFEREATWLRNYQPLLIPGLAQTADYARAIFRGSNTRTEAEVDALVANRMSRQAILGRTRVDLLIDEMVLRRRLGDPAMMRAQLQHLAALVFRTSVSIRVVPHDVVVHPGMNGSFLILDFADQPPLVYVEGRDTSTFLEEKVHIDAARVAWNRLRDLALSPEESAQLIAEITGNLT
jgi:transcriptional regulator with XRE-family HTH domain